MLPVVAQSVLLDTDAQQNRTDTQILGLKEYHRQTEELLQATIKERDCIMELKEILFIVEEDPEGGYTAQTFGESIFTEGDTIDAIKINIKDALRCHFEQN